jgi:hypothetical protein
MPTNTSYRSNSEKRHKQTTTTPSTSLYKYRESVQSTMVGGYGVTYLLLSFHVSLSRIRASDPDSAKKSLVPHENAPVGPCDKHRQGPNVEGRSRRRHFRTGRPVVSLPPTKKMDLVDPEISNMFTLRCSEVSPESKALVDPVRDWGGGHCGEL